MTLSIADRSESMYLRTFKDLLYYYLQIYKKEKPNSQASPLITLNLYDANALKSSLIFLS